MGRLGYKWDAFPRQHKLIIEKQLVHVIGNSNPREFCRIIEGLHRLQCIWKKNVFVTSAINDCLETVFRKEQVYRHIRGKSLRNLIIGFGHKVNLNHIPAYKQGLLDAIHYYGDGIQYRDLPMIMSR